MTQKADQFQPLAQLGSEEPVSEEVAGSVIGFVGSMYGKTNCSSLNALRCEKAGKNIQGKKLPPTEDAFNLHLHHCAYQLLIWRQAVAPMTTRPEPTAYI
jgi:hypothetical protein